MGIQLDVTNRASVTILATRNENQLKLFLLDDGTDMSSIDKLELLFQDSQADEEKTIYVQVVCPDGEVNFTHHDGQLIDPWQSGGWPGTQTVLYYATMKFTLASNVDELLSKFTINVTPPSHATTTWQTISIDPTVVITRGGPDSLAKLHILSRAV
ncbi:MAG TPA: hypothetical protein VNM90_19790 [Haliangium sp.]|nr:hypothetical protein [Haliangium sp.]